MCVCVHKIKQLLLSLVDKQICIYVAICQLIFNLFNLVFRIIDWQRLCK